MIYHWIKDKKPIGKFIKKRRNGDMLIICSGDLNIYYLNKTATFLMEACNGHTSVDKIKHDMLDKYDVSEKELENDLIDTLRMLQWKKLVVLEG